MFDKWDHFFKYFFIVDAYSKTTELYVVDKITTEEVIDKLDIFQASFGKIDKFGWWYLEKISYEGTQFTSM